MKTENQEKVENQTFELSILDSKNLANLQEWEQKQIKLVEENPFIEITDPKSFKEAKSRRTNLKTGRTDLQNQDKLIGSTVASFRKGTIAETKRLIEITTPSEEKQQAEIDRHQAILDEEKEREAKAEEERIEGLKNKITDTETTLVNIIDGIEYDTIDDDQKFFDEIVQGVTNEVDFQEYEFQFNDMIDKNKLLIKATIENVVKDEEKRLVDEMVQGFSETLELDGYTLNPIVGVYEKRGFEISLERLRTFTSSEVDQRIAEVNDKIVEMDRQNHDKIVQAQKERVIQVREGLLDLVHQIDVENYEEQEKHIQKVFKDNNENSSESFEFAKDEFDKMAEMVQKALDRKSEEIDAEKKRINEQIERDLGVFLDECQRRYDVVVEMGFVKTELDDLKTFDGFGMSFTAMEIDAIRPIDFSFFIQETKRKIVMFQEDQKEEERMKGVMVERIKTIVGLGMVQSEDEKTFEGFGLKYDVSEVYEAESLDVLVLEINDYKDADQKEIERKQRLVSDKRKIIDFLDSNMYLRDNSLPLKHKESKDFMEQFKKGLSEYIDQSKEKLNNI